MDFLMRTFAHSCFCACDYDNGTGCVQVFLNIPRCCVGDGGSCFCACDYDNGTGCVQVLLNIPRCYVGGGGGDGILARVAAVRTTHACDWLIACL